MKSKKTIDINADVGEGFNNEAALMPYLSSCNIACGGHAGNLAIMKSVVELAKKHEVKIGAHPSFPDKENFGRIKMNISDADLYESMKHQIETLKTITASESEILHHIKPHGALYNLAAKDAKYAAIIIAVIKANFEDLKLYAPYNSILANLAKAKNIKVVFEAFADRNYNEDLSLVSRQVEDAILTKKEMILNHVLDMVNHKKVVTLNRIEVAIKATTFCVHSDTKNAAEILSYLAQELPKNNIQIN